MAGPHGQGEDDVKKKKAQHDAKEAARDADMAETYEADAIDFALDAHRQR